MACDSRPVILRPLKWIVPERLASMPAMVRIREDLPAPLAPMMATIWPFGTSRETSAEGLGVAVVQIEVLDGEHQTSVSSPR